MNSKKLKQDHPSVYSKFLARNDIVFSMPFVFNMAGTFLHDYRGINMKQKIPLRLYIGVKKHFDTVDYGTITVYDPKNKNFEDASKNSINYLETLLTNLKHIYDLKGLKISILSEIPKGYGLGFNAILCALLETMLCYCNGSVTIEDMLETCNNNINTVFDKTSIGKLLKSENKLNPNVGRVGITTIAASFFADNAPFLFLVKRENVSDNKYYFYRLKELLHRNFSTYNSPLDISLVYSGVPSFMENFSVTYNDFYDWLATGGKRLEKVLDHIDSSSNEGFSMFNNDVLSGKYDISKQYNNFLELFGLEILNYFINSVEGSNTEKQQLQLIAALNKIRLSNFLTKEVNENVKDVLHVLSDSFDRSRNNVALRTHDPIVTGGSIVVGSKLDSIRDKIKNIDSLGLDGVVNFYNSFEDGREEEGIRIEKNEPLKMDAYIVLSTNNGLKKAIDHEEIKDQIQKYDIVFDAINGKIIVNQKTLSSKEILSQQTTVDLFAKLVASDLGVISNKDLYKSSYTDNKSEMQSKIIKPFIQYCEDVFGKDRIQLDLSGTGNHYSIACSTNLSYAVIYKQD